ncbi:unnamed protein product [Cladocopium goreaui]|uniref:SET domain-containing protein n=1 Tax=Cladocopium goreaui TaxID=2562237 RepID=A0A9P1GPJ5_9DINO|nr:unnamed protein product [Cladocopium goreaui]
MSLEVPSRAAWQVLLPRPVPSAPSVPRETPGGGSSSSARRPGVALSSLSSLSLAPLALGAWRSSRGRPGRFRAVRCALPSGLELDTSPDISERPEKRLVPELSRYEDPDDPVRPPAPLRDRAGLWAPPSPEAIGAPEVLVVGLGRRLRVAPEDGPRARLGVGALEALQRRYQIRSYFDADVQGYMATCKASLDKSGRAGVQKIHLMQPLIDDDFDVPTRRDYGPSLNPGIEICNPPCKTRVLRCKARVLFQEASVSKAGKAKPEAVHPQCLKDFDRCTIQVGADIYGPGKAKDLEEARARFAERLCRECSPCSAAALHVVSALCSQLSMAHLSTVSFSGPHSYALPGGCTKARIHLRKEKKDLLLTIERSAAQFESFSLPEDGEVRDCHKSSFINESAELRLLCSDEGVLIDLLDAREAILLCFPDQRVVVHDGLPLNFASPPAGLSTCDLPRALLRHLLSMLLSKSKVA